MSVLCFPSLVLLNNQSNDLCLSLYINLSTTHSRSVMKSMSIFNSDKFDMTLFCYNRLVGKLLCLVELCGAIVIISWCFSTLPLALRFFRSISVFFAGHLFFFIVSNAIILTVLAKSCWLSPSSPAAANAESDLYDELMKNTASETFTSISEIHGHASAAAEEVLFQDKEMIPKAELTVSALTQPEIERSSDLDLAKDFRRTKSEVKYRSEESAGKGAVLRRSETVTRRREIVSGGEKLNQEEEISNEEFQRTIEEFIAKQLKFRRQESFAGVVQACS